ncbi:MAG: hypothetical protein WBR15_08740 [Gammaproteobacteria bacterium]
MNKFFLLILAMLVLCPAVAGDNTKPTLVVPKASGLSPATATPGPTEEASFSGQVWVSGLLIAQWPANLKKLVPGDKIEVSIKLDKKELKKLPYYIWPEWNKSYVPKLVDIFNRDEAIKLTFPKGLGTRLLNKEIQLAEVHAKFLLSNYKIGVECDAPWAHAILVSTDVKGVAQIGNGIDLGGC